MDSVAVIPMEELGEGEVQGHDENTTRGDDKAMRVLFLLLSLVD